jgi:hypothetical protein
MGDDLQHVDNRQASRRYQTSAPSPLEALNCWRASAACCCVRQSLGAHLHERVRMQTCEHASSRTFSHACVYVCHKRSNRRRGSDVCRLEWSRLEGRGEGGQCVCGYGICWKMNS